MLLEAEGWEGNGRKGKDGGESVRERESEVEFVMCDINPMEVEEHTRKC
jgi:hypothetical protein